MGKISKAGIAIGQIIRSEHLLRIISALSGEVPNTEIEISGSLLVSGSVTTTSDATINGLTVGRGGENIDTNTAVGGNTLFSNIIGGSNTAVGLSALFNNTEGDSNTAVGLSALFFNTIGNSNTAVGRSALFFNTIGSFNTAVGSQALLNNTTGSFNIAVGENTLFSNTTGDSNIALGFEAGGKISNGNSLNNTNNSIFIGRDTRALSNDQTNQIIIGHQAVGVGSNSVVLGNTNITTTVLRGDVGIGTTSPQAKLDISADILVNGLRVGRGGGNVDSNTVVGNNALLNNVTSIYNTAVGASALRNNIASFNTAVGFDASRNNTSGGNNTAIGQGCLTFNTTGGSNTAVGSSTLRFNIGSSNTAVGTSALFNNLTSNNNTGVGVTALGWNSAGNNNTAVGFESGRRISNGNNLTNTNDSIFIGRDTRALANDQTNQIVIGDSAIGLGSNSVVLGNNNITLTALRGNILLGTDTNNGIDRLQVSGSVSITDVLTLPPVHPLPSSPPTGSIAVSGSGVDCKPYFWNGTWNSLF